MALLEVPFQGIDNSETICMIWAVVRLDLVIVATMIVELLPTLLHFGLVTVQTLYLTVNSVPVEI